MAEELSEEEELAKPIPEEVFKGFDWNQYNRWEDARNQEDEGFAPFGTYEGQPIPSVADVWTLWPQTQFGRDIRNETTFERFDKTLLKSEFIRNVKIGDILGKGQFGKVYYVECDVLCSLGGRKGTGRIFRSKWRRRGLALKVIQPESPTKDFILDALKDVLALRYLRHKNICNILDIIGIPDRITGFPYAAVSVFFELCDGTLKSAMKEGRQIDEGDQDEDNYQDEAVSEDDDDYGCGVEFEDVVGIQYKGKGGEQNMDEIEGLNYWALPEILSKHWFTQIALAFDYIHEKGFIHKDFHDENVLYQMKPYLTIYAEEDDEMKNYEELFLSSVFKLSDFGQAEYSTGETVEHTEGQLYDIFDLCFCLFETAIPTLPTIAKKYEFLQFCRTGQCVEGIREEWLNLSPEFKDLIQKMPLIQAHVGYNTLSGEPCQINLRDILRHPWLQNNTEPRTQPFIWKEKEKKVIPEVIQKQKRRQTPRYERKSRRIPQIRQMRRQRKRELKERTEREKRMREQRRYLFGSLPFSPHKAI